MSWDPVWENIFHERGQWGMYPPLELVRFIAENYYSVPNRSMIKILELGCGPGGGPSWYIAREGFSYTGIDGSPTAIEKAKKRFTQEGLKGELVLGYFYQLPWAEETFDCVIDVASLQQNCEADATQAIREVYRVIKPGGSHFSLISKNGSWGDGLGVRIDPTSIKNVTEGPYADMGVTRFATLESLEKQYTDFKDLQFEYSIRSMNNGRHEIVDWIVTCRK
ncbi:MAG TPA: class I SAM-dependent methyltransferase [Firmicutes bacterium]|jgi:ubiquinone/menaquinone biosynthesis C-methylase UbiE|nr:class I SAM-dependent methyltransferase [Bacillota bacterium]